MKRRTSILTILLLTALLQFSCNKSTKEQDFGVSISAPKLIGTPAEKFTPEELQTLRISNSLSFLFLNQIYNSTDSLFPFSFSTLGVLSYIYNVSDTNYIAALSQQFSIKDSSTLMQNITNTLSVVSEIDSTIKKSTTFSLNKTSQIPTLTQELQIPIPYEGMLKSKQLPFTLNDSTQRKMTFYQIAGTFGLSQNETALCLDIPLGNGNYSLLIIEPKDWDIKTFASNFTETKYMEIIESLTFQNLKVSLPELSLASSFSLPLPSISGQTPQSVKSLFLTSKLTLQKPTRASFAVEKTDIDTKLQANSKTEHHHINKPFLYILRGKSSNSILLLGIFTGR